MIKNKIFLMLGLSVLSIYSYADTLTKCDSPVATVVVNDLSCKSNGCEASTTNNNPASGFAQLAQMASGESSNTFPGAEKSLSAMLTSRLQATGCFDIQDREALESLKSEMALSGKTMKLTSAKYVITGAVTSISASTKKKELGGGYIPNFVPVLGAMKKTSNNADLSLDIKILDVEHGKVLGSQTFSDNGEKRSYGVSFNQLAGGGGASGIKGSALEPLVSNVLEQIADFSTQKILTQEKAVSRSK